jgi:hypothetical protein
MITVNQHVIVFVVRLEASQKAIRDPKVYARFIKIKALLVGNGSHRDSCRTEVGKQEWAVAAAN